MTAKLTLVDNPEQTISFEEERMIWLFMHYPGDTLDETTLCPDDFVNGFYRSVFTVMLELWRDLNVEPMPMDIAIALRKKSALSDSEAFSIEMDLSRLFHHGVASLANRKYYETEMKRFSEQYEIKSVISKASENVDGGLDANAVAADLALKIEAVKTSEQNDFLFDARACVKLEGERMAENEAIKAGGGDFGIRTGLAELDDKLGPIRATDVCVIAARPGIGKTAFGLTVLLNEVRRGKSVLFVSAEMSRDQLTTRLRSMHSQVPHKKLQLCELSPEQWQRYTESGKTLAEYPFFILDKATCTPGDIAAYAGRLKKRDNLDLLIIDYLTRLTPNHTGETRTREVGKMSAQIKQIAKNLDIPVILLAQLNRDSAKLNKIPGLTDLRDSGEIEQDADQVIFLHKPKDDGSIIFCISKNRNGQVGMVQGRFIDSIVTFVDSA